MPRLATVPRQLTWFMLVGAVSTVVQTLVYVGVREVVPATWASWIALLAVTPLNTELHRRVTFGVKTTRIGRLHGEAGLTSVAVYVANLGVAPWLAGFAGPHPSALVEALILALTGSLIGGARYVLLRGWVFALHRHEPANGSGPGQSAQGQSAQGQSAQGQSAQGQSAQGQSAQGQSAQTGQQAPTGRRALVERARKRRQARVAALQDLRTRRCLATAGSSLRRARRSPAGRRSAAPDQRPASTR
ncbi:GtrA family protein [Actinoplanes sp. GCM10030250]|uniref:GtrA family protein n=1 Tax=Actinoplanes sp. GCM10030250 TaxID=3273376 RepID=UPI0036215CBE